MLYTRAGHCRTVTPLSTGENNSTGAPRCAMSFLHLPLSARGRISGVSSWNARGSASHDEIEKKHCESRDCRGGCTRTPVSGTEDGNVAYRLFARRPGLCRERRAFTPRDDVQWPTSNLPRKMYDVIVCATARAKRKWISQLRKMRKSDNIYTRQFCERYSSLSDVYFLLYIYIFFFED